MCTHKRRPRFQSSCPVRRRVGHRTAAERRPRQEKLQQPGGAAVNEEDRERTLSVHRGSPSLAATIGDTQARNIRRMAHLLRGPSEGRAGKEKVKPRAAYNKEDRKRPLLARRGPSSLVATIGDTISQSIRRTAHLLRAARERHRRTSENSG